METGKPPDDRPSDQPGGLPPDPDVTRERPVADPDVTRERPIAPPPGGPQSPAPGGPQSPGPQSPPPGGPQSPAAPGSPQAPAGPQAPPPSPEGPPGYGGSVPPGGWQTPVQQAPGWASAPLAGWGSRVAATIIDGLILTIPVVVLVLIIIAVASGSDAGGVAVALGGTLAYLLALLFYAPVLMSRGGPRNGQTWGKQIMSIRVTRDSGQPFDLGSGFLREFVVKGLLFGTVGGFFFAIPTILDWLWPLWDDQNRTLHDMVVSTHVLKA